MTSDKSFVNFGEKLDIFEMDLDLLGDIEEMAISTNIKEIESRHPEDIKEDWGKIVINQILEE